jgi:hypothetical protein
MNNITQEDLQRAIRISNAIEDYFRMVLPSKARSHEIYEHLAKLNIIEKDKHNGLHFRRYLKKLKDNNLLHLIPECKWQSSDAGGNEWHFYRISNKKSVKRIKQPNVKPVISHRPVTVEPEIDRLIALARKIINNLPKRDASVFNYQQLETRKNYPRAYEFWTEREIEIMRRAYIKFGRIDKVAELLERQPSVVEKKLEEHKII